MTMEARVMQSCPTQIITLIHISLQVLHQVSDQLSLKFKKFSCGFFYDSVVIISI